jgi:hypothetical protein
VINTRIAFTLMMLAPFDDPFQDRSVHLMVLAI